MSKARKRSFGTAAVLVAMLCAISLAIGCASGNGTGASNSTGGTSMSASPSSTSAASAGASAQAGYGALQSAYYSNSGNSLGNLYSVEAKRDDNGAMIVKTRRADMHSEPIAVREYRAPEDLLDRIDAVVDSVGMKEWGELPLTEFIAYDAPTVSLSLTYENADPNERFPLWLSTSETYELPEGGREALRSIHQMMLEYVTDENLIREYTETTD